MHANVASFIVQAKRREKTTEDYNRKPIGSLIQVEGALVFCCMGAPSYFSNPTNLHRTNTAAQAELGERLAA
jgi:hypothetical protein